jgi:hypothetical protein
VAPVVTGAAVNAAAAAAVAVVANAGSVVNVRSAANVANAPRAAVNVTRVAASAKARAARRVVRHAATTAAGAVAMAVAVNVANVGTAQTTRPTAARQHKPAPMRAMRAPARGRRAPRAVAPANFFDTIPVGEAAAETTEGDREGRRRRRRRGGGGRRDEAGFEPAAGANGAVDVALDESAGTPPAASSERSAEAPRRERERERRDERAATTQAEARADDHAAQGRATPVETAHGVNGAAAQAVSHAPAVMPAVPSFDLPLTDLQQLADGAGLQWVHSDADKVQAVQQAIAAEPKPAHVPRERKPLVLSDDGPLVLVETRKDLSQLTLPFERQAAQGQQPRS